MGLPMCAAAIASFYNENPTPDETGYALLRPWQMFVSSAVLLLGLLVLGLAMRDAIRRNRGVR